MSSVPMANGGTFPSLRIIGHDDRLTEESNGSQDMDESPQIGRCVPSSPLESRAVASPEPVNPHLGEPKLDGSFEPEEEDSNEQGPYHRIREVREQQGVSVRSMARRMKIDIRTYRRLEDPDSDLTLSELSAVQKALDVPLPDLLVDRNSLSRPVEERAKLVKAMKTAVAIRETKSNARVERMGKMLCEQLVDLMPELEDVSGWPQFGARRGQSALGKALCQPIDLSNLGE